MADHRFAQFATSDPGPKALAFWDQRVYFDGTPRRRREIVPTLAVTPGMTEKAARMLLASAPIADGTPAVTPPWFAEDDEKIEDTLEDDDTLQEKSHALATERDHILVSADHPKKPLTPTDQMRVDALQKEIDDLQDQMVGC